MTPAQTPLQTPATIAPLVPAEAAVAGDEHRRFARKNCKLQAQLTIVQTWDAAVAPNTQCDVIVRNISRSGVSFLYFRQLYPDDRITLNFGDLVRHYRVARCRRRDKNCYEIGVAICSAPEQA